jgi:uncharacterized protein (DUF924 family)
MNERAQHVLDFWFGDCESSLAALERHMDIWFEGGELDRRIEREFAVDVERALRGELGEWRKTSQECLALILLLDQFPRNIFRGTARAFAGDATALALVQEGIRTGADRTLTATRRLFFYMPLQHAEDRSAQEESVRVNEDLAQSVPPDWRPPFAVCVKYAVMHRDIIRRFGRFPHRNALLARAATPAEKAYLAGGAPDFGQSG